MAEPRSWGEFMAALAELIGSPDDTGGSQTAGTAMAKGNAILGMLETIYRVSSFQNIANLEPVSIPADISVPYTVKQHNKKLLKSVALERDLYIVSATLSASNGNNGGHLSLSFEVTLDGAIVFNTGISTSYTSSYFKSSSCYYSDIFGGWVTADTISSSIDYAKIPSQKFILCPKGSTLKIYGSGINNGTTGSGNGSCTLKGYYAKA